MVEAELREVSSEEDLAARGEEVRERAQRVEIAPGIDLVSGQDDLRREIPGRARELLGGPGQIMAVGLRREAEVEQLDDVGHAAAAREAHVRGLHVAVHDPEAVHLHERSADLPEDVDHARGGERPVLRHERVEVEPVHVLHDEVRRAVARLAAVEHGDRVRRLQAARDARLALESHAVDRVVAVRREHLDGDGLLHGDVTRAVHDAGAALPDLRA